MEQLMQAYYINFPYGNPEKSSPNIIWPNRDLLCHQNSVFDLIWTRGETCLISGSGDQTGVVIDVER